MAWELSRVTSPPTSCPRTSSARESPMQEIKNRLMPNRHELPFPGLCRRREGEVNRITRFPRRKPEWGRLAWRGLLVGEQALLTSFSTSGLRPFASKSKRGSAILCCLGEFPGAIRENLDNAVPGYKKAIPQAMPENPRSPVQNPAVSSFRAQGRQCCLDKI